MIEKLISPHIASQFPSFYKSDGPNFIAFVEAYYEWMESSNNPLYHSRRLLEYADIDETADQFIKYFKNTYINSLPESIAGDKRLLMKHILDLYRAKGTDRSIKLLFRLLFDESIDLYIPGDYLLKPSDGEWKKRYYIETTSSPYLNDITGKLIRNSSGSSTAVVENYTVKKINQKTINILYLSSLSGEFKYGEKILCADIPELTLSNAPLIVGSMTTIAVENGGFDFSIGDLLSVGGSGFDGRARVAAVKDETGKVNFNLVNGGSGYSLYPNITVSTTKELTITNLSNGVFSNSDIIVDTVSGANATVTFANSSFIQVINFSPNIQFQVGHTITNGNTTALILDSTGGSGSGASFTVGDLIDREIYTINTDVINNYYNTSLDDNAYGYKVNITGTTGTGFTVGNTATSTANVVLLEAFTISTNQVLEGEGLSNTSLGISGLKTYRVDGNFIWCTGSEVDLLNANLVSGVILVSNTTVSSIQLYNNSSKYTITANGTISTVNSTAMVVTSPQGEYVPGKTITDTNTGTTATIVSQDRLSNWFFPSRPSTITNLDTLISDSLNAITVETGKIAYLGRISPGSGYLTAPYIEVVEPNISALNEPDGEGGYKGRNAIINSEVNNKSGIATAVDIIESGFGYVSNETVYLSKEDSEVIIIGSAIVDRNGEEYGKWANRKGFLSDINKLQDSRYYQIFSYEIVAKRMLETYESLVRDLVHPSGLALFGKYQLRSDLVNQQSSISYSSITQT